MKNDMADYFTRRSAELGLERGDAIVIVQGILDARYPGLARALSLNEGLLRIVTPNASLASELRLTQLELLTTMNDQTASEIVITKLVIRVGSL